MLSCSGVRTYLAIRHRLFVGWRLEFYMLWFESGGASLYWVTYVTYDHFTISWWNMLVVLHVLWICKKTFSKTNHFPNQFPPSRDCFQSSHSEKTSTTLNVCLIHQVLSYTNAVARTEHACISKPVLHPSACGNLWYLSFNRYINALILEALRNESLRPDVQKSWNAMLL